MTQFILLHVWKNCLSLLGKFTLKRSMLAQKPGYGLALLMVFLASSVLLATSMSLLLTPGVVSFITGQSSTPLVGSQTQISNAALDAAKNDILNNYLANGTTVDTTYRYPVSGSNSITAPTYPGSGSTTTIGSYYVTVTKARGFTYILQATVTVNGMTRVVSRLYQLSGSKCVYKDPFYFAYSLRPLCPSYTGKAVKVRRSSDNATLDIGFVGGDFDIAALRTFLGEDLPLNVDSTAKAAYSLRKLRDSYTGKAIKVRRSSGTPTTQDIGFNSFGNLDTKALLAFVGTGSGYIDTWYDQSGGTALNLTQATPGNQPRIVNAGVVDTQNGVPALYFGGNQSLSNTGFSGVVTGQELRFFAVAEAETGGAQWGQFAALYKSGDSDAYLSPSGMEVLSLGVSTDRLAANTNNNGGFMNQATGVLFQATTYHNSSGTLKLYYNGVSSGSVGFTEPAPNNLAPTALIIGTGAGTPGDSGSYVTGYISEAVLYNSNVSAANQTKIEKNQQHYYKIANYNTSNAITATLTDGFVTTWYDQSGNGYNLTQATTTAQPAIDLSGSAPGLFFDARYCQTNGASTCDYLGNTSLNKSLSPMTMTALGVGQLSPTAQTSWAGRFLSLYATGTSDDSNSSSAVIINSYATSPITLGSKKDANSSLSVSHRVGSDFQATSIGTGTNRLFRSYQSSTGLVTDTTTGVATEGLTINAIRVGINDGVNNNTFWDGRINEILFFTTALPSGSYQNYESDQRTYYGF